MKNYLKPSIFTLGLILGFGLFSCKKEKAPETSSENPESYTYYDITDVFPGSEVQEILPSESKAEVHLTKSNSTKDSSQDNATVTDSKGNTVTATVPVEDGNLVVDDETIVGGYLSLNFNNVLTSPTGNIAADADVIKGNLVANEADGIMDVQIDQVESMDQVLIKDGIENSHMMKGTVKINGKEQKFHVPVDINKVDDKFELTGIVKLDRGDFYSDQAFNHLSADDLMNDSIKVKVRVNSAGNKGKVTIYDVDKKIKEKVKFKDYNDHMLEKVKEKGDGFKDKDKIMEKHDKQVEKMKEKGDGDKNKEEIEVINGKTIEKLDRHQRKLKAHREKLVMEQDQIKERYKDNEKGGEKENIKINEKLNEIDAKIKEIDEDKNRIKAKGKSTDGGLNNPNAAGNAENDSIN